MTKPTVCAVLCLLSVIAGARVGAQTPPPPPAQQRPGQSATPPADMPAPPPAGAGFALRSDRVVAPQGFSVVLVLGDIQSSGASDDVPLAARKALADMKDFLPFKSYRLLDAAWIMCCGSTGNERRPGSQNNVPRLGQTLSQMLRGPDEQEYELNLSSRIESSQVLIRFSLMSGATPVPEALSTLLRGSVRQLADLKDQAALLEKQIQDQRKKVEVGVVSSDGIAKMETELRRVNREIEDVTTRVAQLRSTPTSPRAGSSEQSNRNAIIDTSFTMNVGETVVVGTSRLKGGSKALIALLTAVPPRAATDRREH